MYSVTEFAIGSCRSLLIELSVIVHLTLKYHVQWAITNLRKEGFPLPCSKQWVTVNVHTGYHLW